MRRRPECRRSAQRCWLDCRWGWWTEQTCCIMLPISSRLDCHCYCSRSGCSKRPGWRVCTEIHWGTGTTATDRIAIVIAAGLAAASARVGECARRSIGDTGTTATDRIAIVIAAGLAAASARVGECSRRTICDTATITTDRIAILIAAWLAGPQLQK